MVCPGSVALCENVIRASSVYADLGTACHHVLEKCLRYGRVPQEFVGTAVTLEAVQVEVTAEMAGWVQEVLEYVLELRASRPGTHLLSEERVRVGIAFNQPDELWGTVDVALVHPAALTVVDAKFGYAEVAIEGNPQLLLYTIGLAAEYGWIFPEYHVAIHQPRNGGPKSAVYSAAQLQDFARRYAPKIAAALEPEAPLVPSDEGCRNCAAAAICPALQRRALALARREFSAIETIPLEDLATLLVEAPRIRAALDAAEGHVLQLIQLGQKVPGFKSVLSDKRRVWKDEKAAVKLMAKLGFKEDDYSPRKMVTPAQAEKLVGGATAARLAPLIDRPKGDPKLVRDLDPRPALEADFTPIEEVPALTTAVDDLID